MADNNQAYQPGNIIVEAKLAKALVKEMKNQHALHVLFIMETLGLGKTEAEVLAWAEGRVGYSKRMAEK